MAMIDTYRMAASPFALCRTPVFDKEGAGGGGESAGENAGGENAGGENAGDDSKGGDNAGGENTGGENTGEKPGSVLGGNTGEKGDGEKAGADDKSEDGEKSDDGEKSGDDVVPEDGKYEFTMPEGVELDNEMAEALSPALKEAGITQGQANQLAAALTEHMQQQAEARGNQATETVEGWVKTAKEDKEIGGQNWDANVDVANTAIAQFGNEEFTKFLSETGVGNHPEMIRFAYRVGKALADDTFTRGQATDTEVPAEERWYKGTTGTKRA